MVLSVQDIKYFLTYFCLTCLSPGTSLTGDPSVLTLVSLLQNFFFIVTDCVAKKLEPLFTTSFFRVSLMFEGDGKSG